MNYLYDGYTLLEEVDSFGSVMARYTHGTKDGDKSPHGGMTALLPSRP